MILSKDIPEEVIAEKLNRSLGAIQLRRHYLKIGQRKSELDEVMLSKLISNL